MKDALDTPIPMNVIFDAAEALGMENERGFMQRYGTRKEMRSADARSIRSMMSSALYYPVVIAHIDPKAVMITGDMRRNAELIAEIASRQGIDPAAVEAEWKVQAAKWERAAGERGRSKDTPPPGRN